MKSNIIDNFLDFMGLKYINGKHRDEIKSIVENFSQIKEYKKGEMILKEGEKAEEIFYLCSGSVKLTKHDAKKRVDNTISIVNPEHLLGVADTILGEDHMLSVKAYDNPSGLLLNKNFVDHINESNELALSFLKFMLEQHKLANQRIIELVTLDDKTRLMNYLEENKGKEFNLEDEQYDLITVLKIKRSKLPKLIEELEEEGKLSKVGDKHIYRG